MLEGNEFWDKVSGFQLRNKKNKDSYVEMRNGELIWYDTNNPDITIPIISFFTIPNAFPANSNIDSLLGTFQEFKQEFENGLL